MTDPKWFELPEHQILIGHTLASPQWPDDEQTRSERRRTRPESDGACADAPERKGG